MRQVRNTSRESVTRRRPATSSSQRVFATASNRLPSCKLRICSSMPDLDNATLHNWLHHWQDEFDAAYLYLVLAGQEPDQKKKEIYVKLAGVEERHTQLWEKLLAEHGHPIATGRARPSLNARVRAWFGRQFGPGYLLPLLLREEGQEVTGYMDLHEQSRLDDARDISLKLAKESAAHAETLAHLAGRASEPWHRTESGGYLRSIVYGFNDGLTANFGLVAGVLGASVAPHIVIISGVAGAIADALSMGSSGYLAAKSEAEVQAHQIEMERHEMRLMPDLEEDELALIYEAKGLTRERARETAKAMMQDPARALETQVREELNIHPAELAPLKDGLVTGSATAVGAFIPIIPFLLMNHGPAVWVSLTISMLAHFAIGAARSMFTGRGSWASGRDMFLVGFGVAGVGYLIGE